MSLINADLCSGCGDPVPQTEPQSIIIRWKSGQRQGKPERAVYCEKCHNRLIKPLMKKPPAKDRPGELERYLEGPK